ncbi:MAG: transporter [Mucilaginibacter sp.]|nr:transporter [Mucilaginibacter sp.]
MNIEQQAVIDELIKLLKGGGAHATLKHALDNLPPQLRGVKPDGLPYSIWQLTEHIRIAQWDMLQFCIDANHQSPKWPDAFWPKEATLESDDVWNRSIEQINNDLHQFIELLKKQDIYKKISHGSGQTILREALQIADHTSYHTGEVIAIRRMLKAW